MFVLFIAFSAVLAIIGFYGFQEKLIFFPEKLAPNHQFSFNEKFEEINFQTEKNVSINALLFYADSSKGLILYFHGNAGSLDSWGLVAKDFLKHNFDVLIIDYRGYGKSTGEISSEEQLHHDAEFIYREMLKKYPEQKVVIYGRSLGSGIASKLAASHSPKLLILETPFFNLKDMASRYYPYLPVGLILKYKFENNVHLAAVKCPVHLIHGTRDEIVPYDSSARLARISEGTKLHRIENGMHNNLAAFDEFHEVLTDILR